MFTLLPFCCNALVKYSRIMVHRSSPNRLLSKWNFETCLKVGSRTFRVFIFILDLTLSFVPSLCWVCSRGRWISKILKIKTGHLYSYVKLNFKVGLFLAFIDLRPPSFVNLTFYIMARAQGKTRWKYQKNAKWQKITFRGPIWVPKVAFWGFWGLVWGGRWS